MVKVPVSRQKLPSLVSIVWEMLHGFSSDLPLNSGIYPEDRRDSGSECERSLPANEPYW